MCPHEHFGLLHSLATMIMNLSLQIALQGLALISSDSASEVESLGPVVICIDFFGVLSFFL